MASRRVGRPSKIDKETMKVADIGFIIILIILILLLSLAVLTVINPSMYDSLKASIKSIFG